MDPEHQAGRPTRRNHSDWKGRRLTSQAIIESALAEFAGRVAVVTSFQREGIAILDQVLRIAPLTPVLTLDTGRLPAATHRIIGEVEKRYGIQVERIRPESSEVEAMVATHGPDLFRDSFAQRRLCCEIRKVRPLSKRLSNVDAYFTGLRRGQSETRANIEAVDRSSTPIKISPLAEWTAADLARYTEAHHLPEHPLYSEGYTSIGCDPCTRATQPGESERAGRWWWETDQSRECGLHFSASGKVERTVDVLLRELLQPIHTA